MGFSAVLSLVLEMVSMSIPSAQILGASRVLSNAVTARPDVFGQGDDQRSRPCSSPWTSIMMLHRAGLYTPMHYAAAAAVVVCVVLFAALVGVSAATGGQVC